MTTHAALIAALAAVLPSPDSHSSIEISISVEAPVAEVYALFATTEGVRTLFPGSDARIEPRVGGDYCVMFDPHGDPTGDRLGTNGCTFVAVDPEVELVFEWRGPEQFTEMNVQPFPTRVRVLFASEDGGTRVRLTHSGFGEGAGWGESRAFFERAWSKTLDLLSDRFARKPQGVPAVRLLETELRYAVRLTHGPAWIEGKPAMAQERMANHAAYMQWLMREGQMCMGGPIADQQGLAILEVPDEASARRLLEADPAVQAGTLVFTIEPWRSPLPSDVAGLRDQ